MNPYHDNVYSRSVTRKIGGSRRWEISILLTAYSFVREQRENDSTFPPKRRKGAGGRGAWQRFKMPRNGACGRHFARPTSNANFSVIKSRETRIQRREAGRKCYSWKIFCPRRSFAHFCANLEMLLESGRILGQNWIVSLSRSFLSLSSDSSILWLRQNVD